MIPGITTDYAATPLDCSTVQQTGLHAFVGGASDGRVGAAAMQYTNPISGALSWQKAWFFLDNDVQHVMIPSINHTTTNAPVYSVLDQKRLNGPVFVNGLYASQLSHLNASHPQTLWHDDVGYVFNPSSQTTLSVQIGPRSGDWSAIGISTQGNATVDLFAAWLNHGTGPSFSPVSYTAFPAISQIKFLQKSLQTRLQDVRNDQIVSAVYDEKNHVLMAVVWDTAGASFTFSPSLLGCPVTVTIDGNSVIVYRLATGEVTVADPSQTRTNLQVSFTAINGVRPILWGSSTKTLTFTLPIGGVAGSSVTRKL